MTTIDATTWRLEAMAMAAAARALREAAMSCPAGDVRELAARGRRAVDDVRAAKGRTMMADRRQDRIDEAGTER